MKHGVIPGSQVLRAAAVALVLTLILGTGCKNKPAARTDQQLTTDIQAKINGESALAGQNIQVSVASGVATLSGTVTDQASRALAGNDSGTVTGVRTVVNNLAVQPPQQAAAPMPSPAAPDFQAAPEPVQRRSEDRRRDKTQEKRRRHDQDQAAQAQAVPTPQVQPQQLAQAVPTPEPQAPPPPPAPPKPEIKELALPAGTIIPVRITETLDSKTAQPNHVFHASLAGDLGTQGVIAIPQGAQVTGRIVDAREAAHFKGSALLSLELTELTAHGKNITLVTDTFSKEGAARGTNRAAKAGGGAAVGAIIGALAGGGKGAAIGGLAGGAAGTGVNAATHGEQAVIPTETLVNFRLQSPITVRVTIPPAPDGASSDLKDPQLQHR